MEDILPLLANLYAASAFSLTRCGGSSLPEGVKGRPSLVR